MSADVPAIVDSYRRFLDDNEGLHYRAFEWIAAVGKYGPLFTGRMVYLLGYQREDLTEFDMDDFDDNHEAMYFDETNGAVSVISMMPIADELFRALSLDGEAVSIRWGINGETWVRLAIEGEMVCTFESPQWRHGSQPDALDAELALLEPALAEPVPRAALMALVQLRTGAELTSEFFTVPHLGL